jgi:hypothetical protein
MRSKAVIAGLMVKEDLITGDNGCAPPPCARPSSDTSGACGFHSEIIRCWKWLKTQVLLWVTVRGGFRSWLIRAR